MNWVSLVFFHGGMKFKNSEYDTFGVIKKLDGIYNFQSSNVKMMALAMSHYHPKNYHPGTFVRLVRVALDYEKDILDDTLF